MKFDVLLFNSVLFAYRSTGSELGKNSSFTTSQLQRCLLTFYFRVVSQEIAYK